MTDKLKVEIWDFEAIKPYPGNAKEHPPEQIKSLANAIRKFGWDQPIVVDQDGIIIKGHGRRLAAIELELKKVPVLVRRDLTPEEVKAARLSDNKVISTHYDTELLQKELAELASIGEIDLTEIGFSEKELEFLGSDLGTMDVGAFVDDIGAAVESQKDANDATVAAIDKTELPLGEAFGFKRVSPDQSRRIKSFMAKLEMETQKKGVEALLGFFDSAGIA